MSLVLHQALNRQSVSGLSTCRSTPSSPWSHWLHASSHKQPPSLGQQSEIQAQNLAVSNSEKVRQGRQLRTNENLPTASKGLSVSLRGWLDSPMKHSKRWPETTADLACLCHGHRQELHPGQMQGMGFTLYSATPAQGYLLSRGCRYRG